jgi:hypothetical protein
MQAKLRLDLDDLAVDTFDTTRGEKSRGTVFGEQCTCQTACNCETAWSCPGNASCGCDSLGHTCQNSCVGTCGCYTWMTECQCAPTCGATACNEGPCCG